MIKIAGGILLAFSVLALGNLIVTEAAVQTCIVQDMESVTKAHGKPLTEGEAAVVKDLCRRANQ